MNSHDLPDSPPDESLSATLRRAIEESGMTCYRLGKMTGIDSGVIRRFLVTNGRDIRLETAGRIAAVLGLELVGEGRPIGATSPGVAANRPALQRSARARIPTCPITLNGPEHSLLVLGVRKPRLTPARYDVLKVLVEFWPDGVTRTELEVWSGHPKAAVKILRGLKRIDADFDAVIGLPGRNYGDGYRLKVPDRDTSGTHEGDT